MVLGLTDTTILRGGRSLVVVGDAAHAAAGDAIAALERGVAKEVHLRVAADRGGAGAGREAVRAVQGADGLDDLLGNEGRKRERHLLAVRGKRGQAATA